MPGLISPSNSVRRLSLTRISRMVSWALLVMYFSRLSRQFPSDPQRLSVASGTPSSASISA